MNTEPNEKVSVDFEDSSKKVLQIQRNHILKIKADSLRQIIFWCNLELVNDVETLVDFISVPSIFWITAPVYCWFHQ